MLPSSSTVVSWFPSSSISPLMNRRTSSATSWSTFFLTSQYRLAVFSRCSRMVSSST
ncbi:hypothetical protein AJOOGB_AJOOGB_10165, partial [Dysosmobacter welbionis]